MSTTFATDLIYPVYQPLMQGREKEYVNACLDSTWISSKGEFIERFEKGFAEFTGVPHAATVSNGTVALHLALMAIGIGPGDEVILPTLTYVASANAILQAGATPVFVDSLASSWQIDPEEIKKKITSRTKAIMVVHLYGHPCPMDEILELCQKHNLLLVEDCAEAFGSYYNGSHVGSFGDVATFSFFGNKTITTGEGGMVISKHQDVHHLAKRLKSQGVSQDKHYWHDLVGYNYRMTNICAAIGLAQLEKAEEILRKKREIAKWYQNLLQELPLVTDPVVGNVVHSYWMCSILLDDPAKRDPLREYLRSKGIETRPFFYPVHQMPMYHRLQAHPVAESLSQRGMNLPSYPGLTEQDIKAITGEIRNFFS